MLSVPPEGGSYDLPLIPPKGALSQFAGYPLTVQDFGMAKRKASESGGGSRGLRGETGETGAKGSTGSTGARGATGPAGPAPKRADILAMVEDQFLVMRKEMSLQLARMAQIQVQLDQIHKMLKNLVIES